MRIDRRGRRLAVISLTPLIDVVFILLVFYLLASSPIRWRALPFDITVSSTGGTPSADTLHVRAHLNGDISFAGERLDGSAFERRLAERLRSGGKRHFVVASDPGVVLQRLIEIHDQIGAAGGRRISLAFPKLAGDAR